MSVCMCVCAHACVRVCVCYWVLLVFMCVFVIPCVCVTGGLSVCCSYCAYVFVSEMFTSHLLEVKVESQVFELESKSSLKSFA